MLFNSWQYVVFLPLVVVVYFLLPQKARWVWLLAASYYFYMSWDVTLVSLIATTTLVSWGTALLIERAGRQAAKRGWLALGAAVSLGMLFFFKYFDFASTSVAVVLNRFGLPVTPVVLSLVLPVGISFYTFQTLGYVIDVYSGAIKAERHLGIYALFVSFFPQLVAGPIERASNLLPQFRRVHKPEPARMAWGLRMICWGLLKKAVIADRLAPYVNAVYNDLDRYTPMTWLLATVLFAVQIFCDFSGYTDIARGSAAMLGFDLMENFKAPYLSRGIQEFWQRWHISLSTWLQDYVFTPLVWSRWTQRLPLIGKHIQKPPVYSSIIITFLVSGLWHGARWNFVLWGLYHGIMNVVGALKAPWRKRLDKRLVNPALRGGVTAVRVLVTFGLVCFGYIFFRSVSLSDVVRIVGGIPAAFSAPIANLAEAFTSLGGSPQLLAGLLAAVGVLLLVDHFAYRGKDPFALLAQKKAPVRAFVSYALALAVLVGVLTMPEGVSLDFIYFQF